MDNGSIQIENSFDEQHVQTNTQQVEQSIENQTSSKEVIKTIKMAKKIPMNPTPLYIIFCFS
jgi:hypothetical protein